MSLLPTDRIFDLRNEIHKNVSQVYANKIQCERLCERIDQLIDPLERLEHASSTIIRDETRLILDKLLQCIDDCNNYIEKLKSSDQWYEEVYEYKKSEKKFKELNKRLSQLGQDLSLGLNIQQLFDRKQDQEDQREDLKDLNKKIDHISQKMLEKQCEQYKLIDKRIDKRFQSFRLYLTQNLLIQQDSNLSKYHQQFLHIPYKDLYIDERPLGHGGFADVYKATWLTHHDQVAIKIIRINHLSNIQDDFYREISTMYRIRYENVLSVLGACIEPNFYAIIVEYMTLGSLADILYKKHEQIIFDWSDRYSVACQMSKSINYLHNLNPSILHRDIKSMNFLLTYSGSFDHKYRVKVCDFGLAEIRHETLSQSTSFPSFQIVGSFYWKAPELLTNQGRHTKQTDIYSLGIVFWELATERKPWDEYEDEAIVLIKVKTGERPTIPSDIPKQYKKLIQDAWNHDPLNRPTCFQLMERIQQEINLTKLATMLLNEEDVIDLHPQKITMEQYSSVISTTYIDSTKTAIEVDEENSEEQKLMDSVRNVIISKPSESEITTDNKIDLAQIETDQIEYEPTTGTFHVGSESITETDHVEYEPITETVEIESEPITETVQIEFEPITETVQIGSESIPETDHVASEPITEIDQIEFEPIIQIVEIESESMTETDHVESEPVIETVQIGSESITEQNAYCSSLNGIEPQNEISSSPTSSSERTLPESTEDIASTFKKENDTRRTYASLYRLEKRRPLHNKSARAEKKNQN